MAFNPARAISFLRNGEHTQEQAQAIVEVIQDSREDLATMAALDQLRLELQADMREQTAEMKIWTLKLVLAQTALMVTIAIGAIVVAGVLWG